MNSLQKSTLNEDLTTSLPIMILNIHDECLLPHKFHVTSKKIESDINNNCITYNITQFISNV